MNNRQQSPSDLNHAIAKYDAAQNAPLAALGNFLNILNGGNYSNLTLHVSKLYVRYPEPRKVWAKHLLIFTRRYVEVRIDAVQRLTQQEFDQDASAWLIQAKEYATFLEPLAYDRDMDQWVFAFRSKSDAMLFKLAHGGAT
ncbi:hypothetical protein PVA19_04195 [Agrobacterium sp. CNPSo 3708]|uniref:hypothetical protein n=1 Tax=Agrobacterium sp. CNPSo 3708 TaxID=3028150 RepID=UPI0023643862|nr:hypothetical protein [Agrobacterium sp. CNPSo 3708]MDD1497602.1 hypothetical protein [Agrobacterium sp. CNPSo 3708]